MLGLLRRLNRPSVAAIADQAIVSIANFLTGVILARGLTQSQFGVYALGLSVVLLALDLQTTLTSTPYMVFGPQLEPKERARYLGSTTLHQLGLGCLVAIGLMTSGSILQGGEDAGSIGRPLVILGLVVVLVLFRDFARRISFADQEPKTALFLDTTTTLLQLGAIVILLRTEMLTVSTAFIAIGLSAGIPSGYWLLTNRNRVHFSKAYTGTDLRRNWDFGRWVLLSGALWSLSLSVYPWLLASTRGTAATATWAVGLGVVSVANPLKLGYQNHLGPEIANRFAAGGMGDLRRAVIAGSWRFGAIVAPVVIALLLIGDWAVVLIYGADYAGLQPLVSLLALDSIVSVVAFASSRGLFVMNRADMDLKVNLVAVGALLLVGVWLAWAFGPVGAAAGLLTANVMATGVRLKVFLKLSGATDE